MNNYPYAQSDRLIGLQLDKAFELSAGATPPSGTAGGAGQFGQWMDTSTSPPTLRIAVVERASTTYVAAEWGTMGTFDLTTKQFSSQTGNVTTGTVVANSASINGPLFVGTTATIDGNVNMASNLGVGGGMTLNGGLDAGHISTSGDLFVGTTTTMNGNVNMASNLGVGGDITCSTDGSFVGVLSAGSINTPGALNVGTTAHIAGDVNMSSDLGVGGDVTCGADGSFVGVLSAGSLTTPGSLFVGTTATIDGNVNMASNLGVGGAATFNGATSVHNTLGVDGALSCAGTVVCQNVNASNDISAVGVYRFHPSGAGAKGARLECFSGGWDFMAFAQSGGSLSISADSGVSGFVFSGTAYSDARLKENIRDTEVDALELLRQTPVRAFEWSDEGRKLMPWAEDVLCGLVAQELVETVALAVGVAPFEGEPQYIKDQHLTAYFIRAIQQIADRLDAGGL